MRYLLDTHAVLWYFEDSDELSPKSEEVIDNPLNCIFVSAASLWEAAIKIGMGRLNVSFEALLSEVENAGFTVLQTESAYLRKLIDMPQIHKDPFDRLIIATALVEEMTLITIDENIQKYDVSWVW